MRLFEIDALPKYDTAAYKAATKINPLDLTPEQQNALHWYRGFGYHQINSKLRGLKPPNNFVETADEMWEIYGYAMSVDDAIDHLDDVAYLAPRRKKTLHVYRGERDKKRAAALRDMEPGGSFVDKGYLSTSLGPSYAFYSFAADDRGSNTLSMIVVPPSVRGAYISNVQDRDDHKELEFLVDRGTRYTLREKRVIPNKNRGHPIKDVVLLVWDASPS